MANVPGTRGGPVAGGPIWATPRRHPRRNIESRLVAVDLGHQATALVVDISEGGMSVHAAAPLHAGDIREFRLELPGSRATFEGSAMVAWVGSRARAGMEFINVPGNCRALLKEWLSTPVDAGVEVPGTAQGVASLPAQQAQAGDKLLLKQRQDNQQFDLQGSLAVVAERAAMVTGAQGAAVAVGSALEMRCCASYGNAPDVGVTVTPDSGLSGICLRTAEWVQCNETETDPRVDPAVCRQLKLRSILIIPVLRDGSLVAMLQVLSSKPYAFPVRHHERLLRLANFISTLLRDVDVAQLSGSVGVTPAAVCAEQFAQTDVASLQNPPATLDLPPAEREEALIDVDSLLEEAVKPDGIVPPGAAREVSGPEESAPVATGSVCDACGYRNPPGAISCEQCDIPMPAALSSLRTEKISQPAQASEKAKASPALDHGAPSLATLRAVEQPPAASASRAGVRNGVIGLVGVVLLACVLGVGWYMMRGRDNVGLTKTTSMIATTAPVKVQSGAPPAETPTASSSQAVSVAASGDTASEITIHQSALAVSALEGSPRSTSELLPGKLLRNVEPIYPPAARAGGIGGSVVLTALVSRTGTVETVKLVRGPEVLAAAAMDAVRQWVYEPYRLDGEPVAVETTIVVKFTPHN